MHVPIFDADNHFYETRDALTKFLPDRYEGLVKWTFDVVARPGAQEDYYRTGNPEGKSRKEIFGKPMRSPAAFREPGPRLELMDELGIDRTLMFPTLASLVEERLREDPDATHALIHSLNQWIYETWQFNMARLMNITTA